MTFESGVDVWAASEELVAFARAAWSMSPSARAADQWGQMVINADGPLTVVEVDADQLAKSWGVLVSGGGAVIINVAGPDPALLSSKVWSYEGGASAGSTLLNFGKASTLTIAGSHDVSILAGFAAVTLKDSTTGSVYADSLSGTGSVNWNGRFSGEAVIPSPGSAVVLACVGATLMTRRRR